jgi:UDP-N-acetylglucosamine 2-epimerase (non-hydrolysing)
LKNVAKYKGTKINTIENTQIDVLRYGLEHLDKATLDVPKEKYVVLSTHRFENIINKERFEKIIGFTELVAKDFKVLMPQHPPTRTQIDKFGLRDRLANNKNIILLPRLEYENYLKAISGSEFVMTDGGGNQEELYHLGKPTLILRDETERKEGLGTTAVLSKLKQEVVSDFIKNYQNYRRKSTTSEVFPSKIIVDAIEQFSRKSE